MPLSHHLWIFGQLAKRQFVQFIYEGWEPNQRAIIQKFAHGMKSKRNSSFSGKKIVLKCNLRDLLAQNCFFF